VDLSASIWYKFSGDNTGVNNASTVITTAGGNALTLLARRSTAGLTVTPLGGSGLGSTGHSVDVWHHLAAVCDNGTLYVYTDGAITTTGSAPAASTIISITIASATKVQTDEFSLWTRALSIAEVNYIFQAGLSFNPYNLSV
jgi:hypothetical protein